MASAPSGPTQAPRGVFPGADSAPISGTITLSANSLGVYSRCARAYWYYKVRGRKAVRSAAALTAGEAIHAAIEAFGTGATIPEQERVIRDVLSKSPPPPEDYRSAPYLCDLMAAFRADLGALFHDWRVEEHEVQGTVELGTVLDMRPHVPRTIPQDQPWPRLRVLWEYRRDLVGVAPDGLRYIVDWKTSSRNEDAHYLAMKVSGQFMGYVWAWNKTHPETPAVGVQPVRIIMRRPSRTGVAYEFPKDGPILFPKERLAEWRDHTLRKVQDIVLRHPEQPDDWPLAAAELGCCRHTYGACDYLPVCSLCPGEDRERYLASDAYEAADAGKPKDLVP